MKTLVLRCSRCPSAIRRAGFFCGAMLCILLAARLILHSLCSDLQLVNRAGFSQAVYDRRGELLRLSLSSDEKYRLWTPLSEISPELIHATLQQEDSWYYWHPGVNPCALVRAAYLTLLRGRRVGGSTISMQVARMRFGIRSTSLRGKITQIVYALALDTVFSKDTLLEAYLNLAPYGANVEGIGAAAIVYFQKDAAHLNASESLTLSVVPQSPARRLPLAGQSNSTLDQARTRLVQRAATFAESSSVYASGTVKTLPFRAPHLVERLLREHPFEPRIYSSLDLSLQTNAENLVHAFVQRNAKLGIRNATVLVIDTTTMRVPIYVGSADYKDFAISGQVDGITARRSPGSALKPFIYALAMDEGLIHPGSLLKDVPFSRAAYNPENYDREFVGPITATDALIRSRNVPAVELLNALGQRRFFTFLENAQIGGLRDPSFYGLSLALGGVEVRMDELLTLYAMLAYGGEYRPLSLTNEREQRSPYHHLLTPEASELTLAILRENPRPTENVALARYARLRPIAWKTGTSFGFRDAWAVGTIGQFSIAVWVGNFSGASNRVFVGRDTAGPLFFSISDMLVAQAGVRETPVRAISHVKKVKVCALSGELPGPFCDHLRESWFIPGKSPIKTCAIHRRVLVDSRTGLRVCEHGEGIPSEGASTPFLVQKVFEFWPSDLMQIFREGGIPRRSPPAFPPSCQVNEALGGDPRILSPDPSIEYGWEPQRGTQIRLKAVLDGDAEKVYWFVDDHLIGSTPPHQELLWGAQPGTFLVRAVDDRGRSDSVVLRVRSNFDSPSTQ